MPLPAGRMAQLVERLDEACRRRHAGWESADAFKLVVEALRADHAEGPAQPDRLDDVAAVFGLDETEAELLWAAVAAHLDGNVAVAYGLLQGGTGMAHPTVGLLLELAGVPLASPGGRRVLGGGGALRLHGLLTVEGQGPWPACTVAAPAEVVDAVVGVEPDDPALARLGRDVVPVAVDGSQAVARALEGGAPLVWVRTPALGAGACAAAAGVASTGLGWLPVDAGLAVPEELVPLLDRAVRHAGLTRRALLVLSGEVVGEAGAAALLTLGASCVPVVVVSRCAWDSAWPVPVPPVVDVGALAPDERARLWRAQAGALVAPGSDLHETLVGLRLPPHGIVESARLARALADARGCPLTSQLVLEAARTVGGTAVGAGRTVAGRRRRPRLDDLVLPGPVLHAVQRLVRWGRYRDRVSAYGALGHGRGVSALFTGGPGTGKTLAAHVVAAELGLELFQVELSTVVDKYIGETEKHLESVFQAAEAMDVVLFFDEADALFGNRSEVKDARDRYANQEVAYLLQRMEQFDGVVLLASNLRGNLDAAFSRRLSTVIAFPDPDDATRRRLWSAHLGQLQELDHADPVDVDRLASVAELAGGDVRNIVLAAAFEAVAAGEPVGMRHVAEAVRQEYVKLGRFLPETLL